MPLFLVVFFSEWEVISWPVVSVAYFVMTLVLAIYTLHFRPVVSLFDFLMKFVDDLFTYFCKLALKNETERSTIPACPSFIVILHMGNT